MEHSRLAISPSGPEFRRLAQTANLIPVYTRFSGDMETPVSAYLKIRDGGKQPSFLLESVEGGERQARYSFLGAWHTDTIRTGLGQKDGESDPLKVFTTKMESLKYAHSPELPSFTGGALGYISYDAVRHFEPVVPPISQEPLGMDIPESILLLTDALLIFDHLKQEMIAVVNARVEDDPAAAYNAATKRIGEIVDVLDGSLMPQKRLLGAPPSHLEPCFDAVDVVCKGAPPPKDPFGAYFANMTRERYESIVNECKRNIRIGELIQVVVSQRLTRRITAPPLDIYRALRSINPSPYMFFLDFCTFQIIGASPELLASVKGGEMAVHPIAGTAPRGATQEEDDIFEKELMENEKEIAEHVMLLDLGRNDVGRVGIPGTVRVTQQMEIERYSHVMHIVSHVTGKLSPDADQFDALRSAFPAGTVSGAPKIRAMQLISELEPVKRGAYAGAVGWFSYSGEMDTCIALRTLIVKDGVAYLQAGGGIVADSQPDAEYKETLQKMSALARAIEIAEFAQQ